MRRGEWKIYLCPLYKSKFEKSEKFVLSFSERDGQWSVDHEENP